MAGGWQQFAAGRGTFSEAVRSQRPNERQAAEMDRAAKGRRELVEWLDQVVPDHRDEHGHPDPFLAGAAMTLTSLHGRGRVSRRMVIERAERSRRRLGEVS